MTIIMKHIRCISSLDESYIWQNRALLGLEYLPTRQNGEAAFWIVTKISIANRVANIKLIVYYYVQIAVCLHYRSVPLFIKSMLKSTLCVCI